MKRALLIAATLSVACVFVHASADDQTPTTIEIVVRGDDGITWNGEAITLDEIAARFDALHGDGPKVVMRIRPDKLASYKQVAAVMSILQKSKANVELGIAGGSAKPE